MKIIEVKPVRGGWAGEIVETIGFDDSVKKF
jgi:hypothetical protein